MPLGSPMHGGSQITAPGSPMPPPPALTQDLPDPAAIARQKDVYHKMLDEQLKQGISVLDQQTKYQRDFLAVQCEQQKRQFLLQLDQQMKAQEMVLTQQYNEQLMALQTSSGQQKAALEQQAMQLAMEYEQRKAEETMYRQQYEIQRQQMEMAMKMSQDYSKIKLAAGHSGAPQPGPPGPSAAGHPRPQLVPGTMDTMPPSPFGTQSGALGAPPAHFPCWQGGTMPHPFPGPGGPPYGSFVPTPVR